MKFFYSLALSIILLLSPALLSAQSKVSTAGKLSVQLNQWGEVYFSFKISQDIDIHLLTRIISIDNIKNDSVFAYANKAMMEKFMLLNIPFEVLDHPQLKDPFMFNGETDNLPMTWNYYPTYSAYESLMSGFQSAYPDLCKIDTITSLSSGRRILIAKISDNVNSQEDEPEFLYTSSIHGDELTGYVLMLQLIDYLLTNYNSNSSITSLVNNTEIWICPLANPDGTFHGGNNTVSGAIRFNANGVDLNRNYPDPQDGPHPDGNAWQPETVAFMNFANAHHFNIGANFHGGSEVFNYPWDTWPQLAADDAWWIHAGRGFADTIHLYSPSTYFDDEQNGITNGYAWYEVNGGRQDYMNYFQHCREVTIEISNIKTPVASSLPTYWNYDYRSFLNFIKEAQFGVRGLVSDSLSGQPISAKVFISGHDIDSSHVYSALPLGDYHRYLAPGTYNLTFSAPGYISKTINGLVVNYNTTNVQDVQLIPSLPTISGTVIYDTDISKPLAGVTIYLKDNSGDTLSSSITNASGQYVFNDILPGTYTYSVNCQLAEGGYSAVDALLILQHFVQLSTLTGLRLKAANVNLSTGVNSVDALMVSQRFVGYISSFPAGPWVFSNDSITVTNYNIIHTIHGLCTGDANASFTP